MRCSIAHADFKCKFLTQNIKLPFVDKQDGKTLLDGDGFEWGRSPAII